jgi:hypothetical protein
MLTPLIIALGAVGLFLLAVGFGWALGAIASDADERIERGRREDRS